ncbi:MAG: glutathione S-transferase N-terminal domain-containing protein [Actinomycetota bacterium]|nr:glutathione S-transferase N-terminal domain-containing protein [Actinomycetota bacterium]
MARVVVFSTSSCPWCTRAKRYLKESGVRFKEVNIERDPKAAQDLVKKTGQMGVPVVKVGSKWIVGFDQPRIEKELARLS